MSLFRPPDVDRLKREGNTRGLVKALRHKRAETRREAAVALSQTAAALKPGTEEASLVLESLCVVVEHDDDPDTRRPALQALGRLGDARAVPVLIELLEHPDDSTPAVIDSLARLRDRRATTPLLELLGEHPDLALPVVDALAALGDPQAVELLVGLLDAPDDWTHGHAARALGNLKDSRAVEPLVRSLLESTLTERRLAAAAALGDLGEPAAVEALIAVVEDEESPRRLRDGSLLALERIGGPLAVDFVDRTQAEKARARDVDVLVRQTGVDEAECGRALEEAGGDVGLARTLLFVRRLEAETGADVIACRRAVEDTGGLDLQEARALLLARRPEVLRSGDVETRVRAASSIVAAVMAGSEHWGKPVGERRDHPSFEPSSGALDTFAEAFAVLGADAPPDVQSQAIRKLLKALPTLELTSAKEKLIATIAGSFWETPSVVDEFIRALASDHILVAAFAAEILGAAAEPRAVEALVPALLRSGHDTFHDALGRICERHPASRRQVAEVLERHLTKRLDEAGPNDEINESTAVRALGHFGDGRSLDLLLRTIRQPWMAYASQAALEDVLAQAPLNEASAASLYAVASLRDPTEKYWEHTSLSEGRYEYAYGGQQLSTRKLDCSRVRELATAALEHRGDEQRERILAALQHVPDATSDWLSEELGIPERLVRKRLESLEQHGNVERVASASAPGAPAVWAAVASSQSSAATSTPAAEQATTTHPTGTTPTASQDERGLGTQRPSAGPERSAEESFADIEALQTDDIERLIDIVLQDSSAARRMAALEKFISGDEPVEVGVLSEVACRSGDRAIRARCVERLRERSNDARGRYLIKAFLEGRDIKPPLNAEERMWAAEALAELL